MRLEPLFSSLAARFQRVRSGLAVGFGDPAVLDALRSLRGGVWMSSDTPSDLPFEDVQFEVVVMDGCVVSRENVREANRVLKPEGYLFFSVDEKTGKQLNGFTPPEIYRIIREGFDIIELQRPKWWTFGRMGRTLTVCARKKAWREHKGFMRGGNLPFTPFRSRT